MNRRSRTDVDGYQIVTNRRVVGDEGRYGENIGIANIMASGPSFRFDFWLAVGT